MQKEVGAHHGVSLLLRHSQFEDVDGNPEGLPVLPMLETPDGGGGVGERELEERELEERVVEEDNAWCMV